MLRVDGEAPLVRLQRGSEDAYAQLAVGRGHFLLPVEGFAASVAEDSEALLSARFSLMDLLDFFDAVWRGDLSPMIAP
ncbi:hypothetical protein StoSoilB3_36940 [Arthrobacter sp. StoSoilB3]|jgi:hypothetical protein|nr:hypothetical protein StoSoilB3_36940 [Arthrobacter sp. StoSoilB3]GGV37384.1 hypothetical protein GCM10010212_27070 [Paenarthrobacter nicotinovorans]